MLHLDNLRLRQTVSAITTLAFVLLMTAPILWAQSQRPFYEAGALDSPRIATLKRAVETGDRVATVAAFWDEISKAGTPLVEPVAGDADYSWVTFLWQAKENTLNVRLTATFWWQVSPA